MEKSPNCGGIVAFIPVIRLWVLVGEAFGGALVFLGEIEAKRLAPTTQWMG